MCGRGERLLASGGMADDVVLRSEGPAEERAVREVMSRAFAGKHAGLVDTLRTSDAWAGLSFVAVEDGVVVGHVSLTRSRLDAPRKLLDVLVLGPLSVAPERQGRGIGSALVRHALTRLGARPEPLVFLEGAPAYYARFGFLPGGPLGFRRPSLRIPEAAFQVLRLPAYDEWMTGTLVYHRIWWDLDAVGLRR